MSVDLFVYLERGKMLSPRRWAEAVRAAGFPLDLDIDFDVDTHTGFLPSRLDGVDTGFEYNAHELTNEDRSDLGIAPPLDFAVTFASRAASREMNASAIAAAVLAQTTGGFVYDPQSGETIQPDAALAWAWARHGEKEAR